MADRYMKKMFNVTNHHGNENQNHSEMSPHTYQDDRYQNPKDKRGGEDVKTLEYLHTAAGNVTWCSQHGKQRSLKKLKIELP